MQVVSMCLEKYAIRKLGFSEIKTIKQNHLWNFKITWRMKEGIYEEKSKKLDSLIFEER